MYREREGFPIVFEGVFAFESVCVDFAERIEKAQVRLYRQHDGRVGVRVDEIEDLADMSLSLTRGQDRPVGGGVLDVKIGKRGVL